MTYKFIMVLHPKLPIYIIKKWKSLTSTNFTFYDITDLDLLFIPLNLIRNYKIKKHLNYFTFKSFNKNFTKEIKNKND